MGEDLTQRWRLYHHRFLPAPQTTWSVQTLQRIVWRKLQSLRVPGILGTLSSRDGINPSDHSGRSSTGISIKSLHPQAIFHPVVSLNAHSTPGSLGSFTTLLSYPFKPPQKGYRLSSSPRFPIGRSSACLLPPIPSRPYCSFGRHQHHNAFFCNLLASSP